MNQKNRKGIITTFYSYKGGVGRTMALANVATLLSLWGKKVLCIDGDIEAPGINYYLEPEERSEYGLIDILKGFQNDRPISWEQAICKPKVESGFKLDNISLILVEGKNQQFNPNSHELNWRELYLKRGFALALEKICEEWRDNFDHILIDSRTGITQIGGVLTIQAPDQLLLFCTANYQGLDGLSELSRHIQERRMDLPLDRPTLPIVPIITSFAGRFERELGDSWLTKFVSKLEFLLDDWIDRNVTANQIVNALKIPYVPRWSFGEELPVLEETGDDSEEISYSLHNIAALVANKLSGTKQLVDDRVIYIDLVRSNTLEGSHSSGSRFVAGKPLVMISSTARDMQDYRSMVMDACLRADTMPNMIENLPALDSDAIEASFRMVDEADIYIGIFAHRYGYVPNGYDISITEMEYKRAKDRGIPILIFMISNEVPVRPKDFDKGRAAEKLDLLKTKLKKQTVVAYFESPKNLRELVFDSLGKVVRQLKAEQGPKNDPALLWARKLHNTSTIPNKPEPFVAHPYTLLQVKGLIGRKSELEFLTDWITKPNLANISIFSIVAIGGMGKSALTWTWFNHIAPQEKQWAGRIWWSFYEKDATFDNFVQKTLAYVSSRSEEEIKNLSISDQRQQLFQILNSEPYLIVFDGLERILVAYASQNAAFLDDDIALDERTANRIAGAMGLPESGGASFVGRHRLRKAADSRVGHFLRQLTQLKQSKILVSTRLYPVDLQTRFGRPMPNCSALFLRGLSDQDALELWRSYGAEGSREEMLPTLQSFDKHPLLLQLLASEVAEYRSAPGNFDAWRRSNPDFNVFGLPLVQVQSHVLSYALRGLSTAELQTLRVIAGFRMPATMETLRGLLLSNGDVKSESVFTSEAALDSALTVLEDKGLLGWDRTTNRYDLHPIIRAVVWNNVRIEEKNEILGSLREYFSAMPIVQYSEVDSIDDLKTSIGLFNSLIEMELYNDAYIVFKSNLDKVTLKRLSASRLRIELLSLFFADNLQQSLLLTDSSKQSRVLSSLAQGFLYSGSPAKAIELFSRAKKVGKVDGNYEERATIIFDEVFAHLHVGELQSLDALINSIVVLNEKENKESIRLYALIAFTKSTRIKKGVGALGNKITNNKVLLPTGSSTGSSRSMLNSLMSELSFFGGNYLLSKTMAEEASKAEEANRDERDRVRAIRSLGLVFSYLDNFDKAEDRLFEALKAARVVDLVEEEIQTLTALAELHRRKNELAKAREYLDDIWDYAEEGPYPLFHADALNVLAQIEMDAGNTEDAIKAATKAYELAWCDGPPYAYHYGLENAKELLQKLDAPEPELPPFDPSQFEPMPEMPEIDLEAFLEEEE